MNIMFKRIIAIYLLALAFRHVFLMQEERGGVVLGNDFEYRRGRSLFALGKRASKTLLQNARRVGKQGRQTVYMKHGGYQEAVDDFYSVKPSMVKNYKLPGISGKVLTVKGGTVGDRTITLMKREKGEPTTLTITISKDIIALLELIFQQL